MAVRVRRYGAACRPWQESWREALRHSILVSCQRLVQPWVRQWRGHTHAVLVREDGFEYESQHYRSLTVIAEHITGAHWSGPRFFGLTRRAGASVAAAGRLGSRRSTARGG